ncbi:MAG: flavodoxin family protein [Syntrophorhabdales bacterium]|jgi:multimeric flavodoxin WrbA
MKIVALVGSPRKGRGNTAGLVDLVLAGAKEGGGQGDVIYLPGDTVRPCRGCDVCHVSGSCGQKDEFASIRDRIMAADGLVLASPNYIDHVSAQLKAFIDRCCGVVHTLGFSGRYGAAVVTSGGGPEEPIARYLERVLVVTGIVPVGSVGATMGQAQQVYPGDVETAARDLGRGLVEAWKEKKRFPDAERDIAAFRERMRWLVTSRKDVWAYEYDYWKTHLGLTS